MLHCKDADAPAVITYEARTISAWCTVYLKAKLYARLSERRLTIYDKEC